jgi:hypothetical protein
MKRKGGVGLRCIREQRSKLLKYRKTEFAAGEPSNSWLTRLAGVSLSPIF